MHLYFVGSRNIGTFDFEGPTFEDIWQQLVFEMELHDLKVTLLRTVVAVEHGDSLVDQFRIREACEHCNAEPGVVTDFRGLDVISKYWLGATCAAITDEEFFGETAQAPSGGS